MKKISEGRYEVLVAKSDAIDRLIQLQGVCRESISTENPIEFYCSKKGKITITNSLTSSRSIDGDNATNLYGEIIEQDGKVYVTYYTAFSQVSNILKILFLLIYFLMILFSVAVTVMGKAEMKIYLVPVFALFLLLYGAKLFASMKEKKNSSDDSEILIKELENRIDAVNYWEK